MALHLRHWVWPVVGCNGRAALNSRLAATAVCLTAGTKTQPAACTEQPPPSFHIQTILKLVMSGGGLYEKTVEVLAHYAQ